MNSIVLLNSVSFSKELSPVENIIQSDNIVLVVVAALLSGLIGVIVTLVIQKRMAKKTEKMWLFKTLMSLRSLGVSYDKTKALNLIDVIFYDAENVTAAWKILYDSYGKDEADYTQRHDNFISLLEEMAKHLNYNKLDWKKIKESYLPVGISTDMINDAEARENMGVILKMMKNAGINFLQSPQQGNPAPPQRKNRNNKS